jgi:hypothetical protein
VRLRRATGQSRNIGCWNRSSGNTQRSQIATVRRMQCANGTGARVSGLRSPLADERQKAGVPTLCPPTGPFCINVHEIGSISIALHACVLASRRTECTQLAVFLQLIQIRVQASWAPRQSIGVYGRRGLMFPAGLGLLH